MLNRRSLLRGLVGGSALGGMASSLNASVPDSKQIVGTSQPDDSVMRSIRLEIHANLYVEGWKLYSQMLGGKIMFRSLIQDESCAVGSHWKLKTHINRKELRNLQTAGMEIIMHNERSLTIQAVVDRDDAGNPRMIKPWWESHKCSHVIRVGAIQGRCLRFSDADEYREFANFLREIGFETNERYWDCEPSPWFIKHNTPMTSVPPCYIERLASASRQ